MSVYLKSLKREATNYVVRHLGIYSLEMLRDLPNNLKIDLVEQILRIKTYSHMLKSPECYPNKTSLEVDHSTSNLKQQMTALVNPEIPRLMWTLENPVGDLEVLTKCKGLRSLQLYVHVELQSRTPSSGQVDYFSRLFPLLPHLMELKLSHVDDVTAALVTDQVLFTLCKNCPLLFSLSLENCVCLTDACMEAVSPLRMRVLNLSNTRITDAAFVNVRQSSPLFNTLRELKVKDCLFLSNAIVKCFLIRCESLVFLNCQGCPSLNNLDLLFSSNAKMQIYCTYYM